jgi:hypothetical protein
MADAQMQHVYGFVASCVSPDQIARIQTWILDKFGPYTIEYASTNSHHIFMQFKLFTPVRNTLVAQMTTLMGARRIEIVDRIAPRHHDPVLDGADVSAIYVNATGSDPSMPPEYEPPHSK